MRDIDDLRPVALRLAAMHRPPNRFADDHLMIVFNNFADQWTLPTFLEALIAKNKNRTMTEVAKTMLAKVKK